MKQFIILIIILFSSSTYSQEEDLELINDLNTGIRKMDLVVLEMITEFIEFNSETGALEIHTSDLEKVTNLINKIHPSKIIIQVHTTAKGEAEENYRISVIAAQNLKEIFSSKHINKDRIEAIGMGETNPIKIDCSEKDDQLYNKRVKLTLQFHTD